MKEARYNDKTDFLKQKELESLQKGRKRPAILYFEMPLEALQRHQMRSINKTNKKISEVELIRKCGGKRQR